MVELGFADRFEVDELPPDTEVEPDEDPDTVFPDETEEPEGDAWDTAELGTSEMVDNE